MNRHLDHSRGFKHGPVGGTWCKPSITLSFPRMLPLYHSPSTSMGSVIRRALALFACAVVAASWTTVLAQQGVDVDQIAISAATNVCVLFV